MSEALREARHRAEVAEAAAAAMAEQRDRLREALEEALGFVTACPEDCGCGAPQARAKARAALEQG